MSYLIFSLVILVMLAGVVGAIVPVIPGLPLIWLGYLGYGFYDHWQAFGFYTMLVTGLIAAASLAVDQLAGVVGAKKFGAGRAGMIGAFVGAIIGLIILNLIGLIIGTFAGAALFELVFAGRNLRQSLNAGTGALLGFLTGSLFKFIASLILMFSFIYLVARNWL